MAWELGCKAPQRDKNYRGKLALFGTYLYGLELAACGKQP